jgi:hypothetical protein
MAAWVPRRGAIIANLQGTAGNFRMIVNATSGTHDLPALCQVMEEVITAASPRLQLDERRRDAWRGVRGASAISTRAFPQRDHFRSAEIKHTVPGLAVTGPLRLLNCKTSPPARFPIPGTAKTEKKRMPIGQHL